MNLEWDDEKNRANIAKHGVRLEDAECIFSGFTLDREDERFEYREQRVISIGMLNHVAILTVAHTDRNGAVRIISSRPAKAMERKAYERTLRKALDPR